MTQQAELLQRIEKLPPKYIDEVIDFVDFLIEKSQNEDDSKNTVTKAELLREIEKLPPKYIDEVIDFIGYLKQKAWNEDSNTDPLPVPNPPPNLIIPCKATLCDVQYKPCTLLITTMSPRSSMPPCGRRA